MDQRLHERLQAWHDHINKMEEAERVFLTLESQEKSLFGSLFLNAEGKNVAEKEARVHSSHQWVEYKAGLVEATVQFNKMKRELALRQAGFQASYLNAKTENDAILRFPKEVT